MGKESETEKTFYFAPSKKVFVEENWSDFSNKNESFGPLDYYGFVLKGNSLPHPLCPLPSLLVAVLPNYELTKMKSLVWVS